MRPLPAASGRCSSAGCSWRSGTISSIYQFPSLLLWLKLGWFAHVLVGIFIALAGFIRALAIMPHTLAQ